MDFEDWHQLVRRRLGMRAWQQPGPALRRQTEALLALLARLDVRATFFILGISARSHPELVAEISARGHEIACHGDQHELVHRLTPQQFAADLRAARSTIERLTGQTPVGYRAPAFSITRSAQWAYGVLAAEGFAYDSSQHDSPRIRGRIAQDGAEPHLLKLDQGQALWEFPLAVWRLGGMRLPVGGASYWSVLPIAAVLRGLSAAGPMPALYLHPHEFDPEPLRADLDASSSAAARVRARLRGVQRNAARRRAPQVLRAIASRYRPMTYGEAHAQLSGGAGAGS